MKVSKLAEKTSWNVYGDPKKFDKEIEGVYVGDLLSWVMGHGKVAQAWLTIQSHANVLAVASLKEFSCLIICENDGLSTEFIQQVLDEEVLVLTTSLSIYDVCKKLIELGV
ncbi:MAG: hypothetical protein PHP11_02010 [Erysipelotrichaceae bacterium]|nr:hypothetical protein [Erysipelotrichaceae bacterium]MDD3923861.1 hypothetical protein [Erysipelotrichaceae bacterium]MDD4641913.1 hypothetical protein [Erysipelotrichaceae bacterium]